MAPLPPPQTQHRRRVQCRGHTSAHTLVINANGAVAEADKQQLPPGVVRVNGGDLVVRGADGLVHPLLVHVEDVDLA